MHRTVTSYQYYIVYLKVAMRIDLNMFSPQTTTKKWQLCAVMDVLPNITVVITSQYICRSNHHIVYLNLHNIICRLYLNKAGGGKERKSTSKKENLNTIKA